MLYATNSGLLFNELDSANSINNYFVSIGQKLDAALPDAPNPNTLYNVDVTLRYEPDVTLPLFLNLVDKLDVLKHSGCRLIPSKLYRDTMRTLPKQFVYLFP